MVMALAMALVMALAMALVMALAMALVMALAEKQGTKMFEALMKFGRVIEDEKF